MGADRVRVWPSSASTALMPSREKASAGRETLVSMTTARETGAVLGGIGGGQRILQMREEGVVPPGLCLKAAVTAQAGIVKAVTGVPLEVNGGAVAGLVGDGQGLLSLLRAGDGAEAEDIPAVLGGCRSSPCR